MAEVHTLQKTPCGGKPSVHWDKLLAEGKPEAKTPPTPEVARLPTEQLTRFIGALREANSISSRIQNFQEFQDFLKDHGPGLNFLDLRAIMAAAFQTHCFAKSAYPLIFVWHEDKLITDEQRLMLLEHALDGMSDISLSAAIALVGSTFNGENPELRKKVFDKLCALLPNQRNEMFQQLIGLPLSTEELARVLELVLTFFTASDICSCEVFFKQLPDDKRKGLAVKAIAGRPEAAEWAEAAIAGKGNMADVWPAALSAMEERMVPSCSLGTDYFRRVAKSVKHFPERYRQELFDKCTENLLRRNELELQTFSSPSSTWENFLSYLPDRNKLRVASARMMESTPDLPLLLKTLISLPEGMVSDPVWHKMIGRIRMLLKHKSKDQRLSGLGLCVKLPEERQSKEDWKLAYKVAKGFVYWPDSDDHPGLEQAAETMRAIPLFPACYRRKLMPHAVFFAASSANTKAAIEECICRLPDEEAEDAVRKMLRGSFGVAYVGLSYFFNKMPLEKRTIGLAMVAVNAMRWLAAPGSGSSGHGEQAAQFLSHFKKGHRTGLVVDIASSVDWGAAKVALELISKMDADEQEDCMWEAAATGLTRAIRRGRVKVSETLGFISLLPARFQLAPVKAALPLWYPGFGVWTIYTGLPKEQQSMKEYKAAAKKMEKIVSDTRRMNAVSDETPVVAIGALPVQFRARLLEKVFSLGMERHTMRAFVIFKDLPENEKTEKLYLAVVKELNRINSLREANSPGSRSDEINHLFNEARSVLPKRYRHIVFPQSGVGGN